MDSHGNELFKLKKKLLSFFKSHEAFSPDGSMLFEVEGHFQCKCLSSSVRLRTTSIEQQAFGNLTSSSKSFRLMDFVYKYWEAR